MYTIISFAFTYLIFFLVSRFVGISLVIYNSDEKYTLKDAYDDMAMYAVPVYGEIVLLRDVFGRMFKNFWERYFKWLKGIE